jgi:hypothetical protein
VTSPPQRWYQPFSRAFQALIEWSAHLLVVAGLLGGFRLIELVVEKLWGPSEYIFFGKLPLRYVFHAADFGILVGLQLRRVQGYRHIYLGNSEPP